MEHLSTVFSPAQVAETLGCGVSDVCSIRGFPPLVDGVDDEGNPLRGHAVADVAAWIDRITIDARSKARVLISLSEAAELLGVQDDYLVQTCTPGMPRHDRTAPQPIFVGDIAGFVGQEVEAFRDRCAAMARAAGGTVH